MKNYKLIMPLFLFGTVALTSCKVTRDPNKEFMDTALEYYTKLRQKLNIEDGKDYKAWYFDPTSLKGALFDNEKSYKYLGIINVQNMTFSEVENSHFIDIPNYNVKVNMDDMSFELPPELNLEDPVKFIKEFPLVLIKKGDSFDYNNVYNKFNVNDAKEVELSSSAQATNYNPNLFFINGFKYEIKNDGNTIANLDYSDCSLAILKRDVIELINEKMNGSTDENTSEEVKKAQDAGAPLPFDIIKGFLKSYNKANSLPADTNLKINPTLDIPGYFGKDETGNPYPVAVGPLAFDSLFKSQTVKDVQYVNFHEGVKKIAFNAFDSTNIRDIKFPTTLEQIDFSAFSNIPTLNSVYFTDTAKEVKTFLSNGTENQFEISQGEGKDPIKIKICESFANSAIQKVTFENYDNKSINNINMNGFIKPEGKSDIDCIEFVTKDGSSSYKNLSDALKATDTINTAFQFETDEITNANVSEIGADKTIYLAHKKGNGFGRLFKNLNEYHETAYESIKPDKASVTLKLESDLTLKGNIIVGGVTGRENIENKKYFKEGGVVGQYGQIDLNGHKLTVDGGFLDVNGKIIDSSKEKTGFIDVINNGVFKTNLVIKDSFSRKNYVAKFNNSDFPYHYYDFEDCEVNFKISNDSRFYVKETVTKNAIEINVHTFLYAGKNPTTETVEGITPFDYQKELPETKTLPFIEFKDNLGTLNVKRNAKNTELVLNGGINLNTLKLSAEALNKEENDKIVSKMFVPLTSKDLNVTLAKGANVTSNIQVKLLNDSELKIEDGAILTLKKSLIAYDENLNVPSDSIDVPDFSSGKASLIVNGTLKIDSPIDPVYFGGHMVAGTSQILNNLINLANKDLKIGIVVPEGGLENNDYKVGTFYKSYIYIDTNIDPEVYTRENDLYYTQYTVSESVKTIEVKNVNSGQIISKKIGTGNWDIHLPGTPGEVIHTENTSLKDRLTSYSDKEGIIDRNFVIDEQTGNWKKIASNFNETKHVYELEGNKVAIKYADNLIQGILNPIDSTNNYFEAESGLQEKFFFKNGNWQKVQLFEHNRIICYLKTNETPSLNFDINKYDNIDLIGTGGTTTNYSTNNFAFDGATHIITIDPKSPSKVMKGVTETGIVDLEFINESRALYQAKGTSDKYIYALETSRPEESFFKKIVDLEFNEKKATAKLSDLVTFGFTSNGSWQKGLVDNKDSHKEFTLFQIADEKDINRNFALLRTNKEGYESYDVFTKASGIKINRTELEPGIGDLLPNDDDYIGFRYIIIDGVKKAFIQRQPKNPGDPIKTELITIPNDIPFKNKEDFKKTPDYKLNIFDAFQLVSFALPENGKKTNFYMDFNNTIVSGSGSKEEIESGKYLALVIYTDKDIFKEVGGIPNPGEGGLPNPGEGGLPIPGEGGIEIPNINTGK